MERAHGLRVTYLAGCRCDDCRQAQREYDQQRRARNPRVREQARERSRRYRQRHPDRAAAAAKQWLAEHPDQARALARRAQEAFRLRSRHLLEHERDALLAAQDGRCAICRNADKRALSIDHAHGTGRVRGLLCRRCNLGLGCFGDDIAFLEAAITYLRRTAA
jgi:hypothetical protein